MLNKHQHIKSGISFIEILVVLLLVSLFMSFVIPRFLSSQQGRAKKLFFTEFKTLVTDTMHQAVMKKKVHQIYWDLDHHEIIAKVHDSELNEKSKHDQFKSVPTDIFASKIKLPTHFTIRNFFIQGNEDEMKSGETKHFIWTYIMPDGTSQQVIANIQDENEQHNNRFSITINPFYSQVSLHDTFQKP